MPASKNKTSSKKKGPSTVRGTQIDLLFVGPLLFVPEVDSDKIKGLDVYCPRNGHPMGAVFLPGVFFSADELEDPKCERWPEPLRFSLLDPHSYSIEITQRAKASDASLQVADIPANNFRVKPGRRLSQDWDVAIQVNGRLSGWSSHRVSNVTPEMFVGSDKPTVSAVSSLQRLTYKDVTRMEFFGTSAESGDYLRSNLSKGGTLVIIGEIPYQPSLLHERQSIDAIAKLAGLNLQLVTTAPVATAQQVMHHIINCLMSVIVV
jgi:hypothetical protein